MQSRRVLGTNICMILMVFLGTRSSFLTAVAAYLVACATLVLIHTRKPSRRGISHRSRAFDLGAEYANPVLDGT